MLVSLARCAVVRAPLAAPRSGAPLRNYAASRSAQPSRAAPTSHAAAAAAPVDPNTKQFEYNRPFQTYKIDGLPDKATSSKDELLRLYREMSRMRRLEIAADQLYKSKEVRGFCHLYLGQEAIAAGMEAAVTHQDHVITAYRDHAAMLGRGDTMTSVLAELLGRKDGCSRGKGGSMHMYRRETNFYGGNGIVGAQVPIGAGIAFAQKYLKTGKVCLAFYGDGAANQGQIYEAFNMAQLWQLPVLFCCENNLFGMGTSIERATAMPTFFNKGLYIPGIWIDGMDVLAVKEGVKFAADWSRTHGPLVLEFNTYRYAGHSMSDPGTSYRTREDIAKVRETRDPLALTKKRLTDAGWATDEELKEIEREVKKETDEAVAAARASPEPELSETYAHVFKEPTFIRGVELTNSFHP